QLLASYKKGEKSAFLILYKNHSSPLKKFLHGGFSFSSQGRLYRFRGVDPSMDIDAIVQETFTRAFMPSTRINYDGIRPFQTYLFSIAKNLVLRECHHRDRLINVERVEDTPEPVGNYPFCSRENYGESPETHMQNLQLKELTDRFIGRLNSEEKQFFSLRFSQGNTQEGSAKLMNTTRARIKLLEKNLRKQFLDLLKKNGYLVDHKLNPRWKRKLNEQSKAA
ncbi:MAG: sigma-70 family RNA polymerase sigma factor, partial [Myxococcales bacterium]|nr:sigma-70 family RNA polymerase sigma factor [Myxococcales bacterium]